MKISAWISGALAALGAALLPACDVVNLPEIKPGITTAAEVRSRLGNPAYEFGNDDGSATWEYNRQPNGTTCYMITIGNDQIVRTLEQVLTAANLGKIRASMSRDDVRRLIGGPGSRVVFDNLGEDVWELRIAGANPLEETYFMVHFDLQTDGVKKTSQRVATKG